MSRTQYVLPHCAMEGVKLLFPTLDFSRIQFFVKKNEWAPSDSKSETMAYLDRTEITMSWKFGMSFLTWPPYVGTVGAVQGPCDPVYYQLLCHELVHALQAQGFWNRVNHRAASFVCWLFHGNEKDDAAEGNCVEKEAYDYDAQILALLKSSDVPKPCLCGGGTGGILEKIVNPLLPVRNPAFENLVKSKPEIVKMTAGCSPWDCIPRGVIGGVAGFIATILAYVGGFIHAFSTGPISTGTVIVSAAIGAAAGAAFGIAGMVGGAIIGAIIGVFLGNIIEAIVGLFGGGEGSVNLRFSRDKGNTWPDDLKHTLDRSAEPVSLSFGQRAINQEVMPPTDPPSYVTVDIVERLSVAWTGLDNHVNLMTVWSEKGFKTDFEKSEDCGPAVCSAGLRVHIAWQGTDNALNTISTHDGLLLLNKLTLAGTELPSDASPSMCYTGTHYVLIHIGTNGKIYLLTSPNGITDWGNMLPLDELATEESSVAVTAFDNQSIMIAWTGEDDYINLMELQVATNGTMTPIFNRTLGERSSADAGPALAFANGLLFLAWTGTDGQLNFMVSEDRGRHFANHQVFEWSRKDCGPALAAHSDGTVCIGWVGTDN